MTRILAAIAGTLLLAIGANDACAQGGAGWKARPSLDVGIERFAWEELGRAGDQLLTEDGVRFTVGLKAHTFDRASRGPLYSLLGRLYLGEVKYDGQTQDPYNGANDGLPLQADAVYVGAVGEALVGQRYGGRQGMDLLAGVGVNNWVREIQASQTTSGNTVLRTGDAVEHYFILYTKLGVGIYRRGASGYGHFQVGAKYPFYTYEYADGPDVTLEPGAEWSGYAQLRVGIAARFDVTLYYDSFRFGRSPAEPAYNNGLPVIVSQPESHMDVIGLSVGMLF